WPGPDGAGGNADASRQAAGPPGDGPVTRRQMARTGRRPGAGATRERILAAARSHFARDGYEGATIRGIAAAAKVDPKLVLHYFESQEGGFIASVQFP